MPIYEYRCASCGHELEALQKLSEAPLRDCPACHKAELRKLVSAVGFQLKGSGWYVTDFRNSGTKQASKDGASKANGGDTARTDAKPAEAKAGDGSASAAKPSGESSATTPAATSKSET